MSTTPIRADTAAAGVAELVDRLTADASMRIVDATGSRSRAYTGADLAGLLRRRAHSLAAKGVAAGDTVLFAVRPSLNAVAGFLALVLLGARTAFIDLREPADVVAARVELAAPTWVLTDPVTGLVARRPIPWLARRFGVRIPPIRRLGPRLVTTRDRRSPHPGTRPPPPGPDEDALVLFTSGTTAAPRAVVHSQATLGATFATLVGTMGDQRGRVVYSDRFHGFVPAIAAGASVVIGTPGAGPQRTAEIIATHDVTTWSTTPSDAIDALPVLKAPNRLRHIVLSAAPVTRSLVEEIARRLPNVEITAVYGMTEVVPVAAAAGTAIVAHAGPGNLVGRAAPSLEVEFDDTGELVVAGPRVGRYLGEPRGPIRTGDVGYLTPRGEVVLLGRTSDMILVRARNIYPQLYEHGCRQLPGVVDGALVGVPNVHGDEELWLFVELESPQTPMQEVVAAVRSNDHLAGLPISGLVTGRLEYGGRARRLDRADLRRRVAAALAAGNVWPLGPR